jgi:hypothetical protein
MGGQLSLREHLLVWHRFVVQQRESDFECHYRIQVGTNLGPNAAKIGPRLGTTTQNKAKRTNEIDFLSRLCKQGVAGSIPATSTRTLGVSSRQFTLHFRSPIAQVVLSPSPKSNAAA